MLSINVDLDYFNHPKVMRLIGLLGNDADVIPVRLWTYCGKFHEDDGKLTGYTIAEIERIMGWRGTQGKCITALVNLKFLDVIDGVYQVHNWLEYESHISRYKKQGKVMRESKLKKLGRGRSKEPSEEEAPQKKSTDLFDNNLNKE